MTDKLENDYDCAELKIKFDNKGGFFTVAEPTREQFLDLGRKDLDEDELIEKNRKFLSDHLIELGGFTIRGEKPKVEDFDAFPLSLSTKISKAFYKAIEGFAGIEEDKKKKK